MPEPKTSPRRIQAAEKRVRALQLRKAGATYQQIADQVGYRDRSNAAQAVKQELAELPKEVANEVRELELQRLDNLITAMWPGAIQGDWKVTETILKIMERRARLLGLDAPIESRVEVVTESVVDKAIAELEAQLAARADVGQG